MDVTRLSRETNGVALRSSLGLSEVAENRISSETSNRHRRFSPVFRVTGHRIRATRPIHLFSSIYSQSFANPGSAGGRARVPNGVPKIPVRAGCTRNSERATFDSHRRRRSTSLFFSSSFLLSSFFLFFYEATPHICPEKLQKDPGTQSQSPPRLEFFPRGNFRRIYSNPSIDERGEVSRVAI